jgi:tRNA (guanine26-N2/guanine27-N2)-dimethyltransferase
MSTTTAAAAAPVDPANLQVIQEGTVRMEYDSREVVFYNKVQVLNRDLSINVIRTFSEKYLAEKLEKTKHARKNSESAEQVPEDSAPSGIKILDALSASGLRSIRYLKEIPQANHVFINDLSPDATKQAERNCQGNGIDMSRVTLNTDDATMVMYQHRDPRTQFDVIDLDPYGSAAPFLDSAVQAVRNGGLLCITCTDMSVLSGGYPEKCFSQYNSMPVRGKYLHELSLRMLLHSVDSTANKYRRYIVPWISLSVDYYVRVFVRVYESPQEVKNSMCRRSMIYQCIECPTYYLHTLGKQNASKTAYAANLDYTPAACEHCGGRLRLGGPIWSAPIHDQSIVDEVLQRIKEANANPDPLFPVATAKRLIGILTAISEELKDVVLHYSLPQLGSTVHMQTPTMQEFRSALENSNYRVSQFHHDPNALKTDAPTSFIWDVIRTMYKTAGQHPIEMHEDPKEDTEGASDEPVEKSDVGGASTATKSGGVSKKRKGLSSTAFNILRQGISHPVDLTVKEVRQRDRSVARFAPNPEENWGPKRRAGKMNTAASTGSDSMDVTEFDDQEEKLPVEKKTRLT